MFKVCNWGFIIVFFLLFGSCQKDTDVFIPYEREAESFNRFEGSIAGFFERAKVNPLIVEINGDDDEEIFTPNLIKINIPALSFVKPDGSSANGVISLEITENLSKKNILLTRRSTVSREHFFQTTGILHLKAFQEGLPLQLADEAIITINMPSALAADRISIHLAQDSEARYLDWKNISDVSVPVSTSYLNPNNGLEITGIQFTIDELGWVGPLASTDAPDGVIELCINLPEGYDPSNTSLFFVPENNLAVVELMWRQNSGEDQFCFRRIPAGLKGKVLSISEWEDGLNAWTIRNIEITPGVRQVLNLTPDQSTFAQIIEALDDL